MTNQRTDAVSAFVLDPYEVASLKMWPLWGLEERGNEEVRETLDRAEYTVYKEELVGSELGAVLNEAGIPERETLELPRSYHARIAPAGWEARNEHPDVRLARRAQNLASLARVCAERRVSLGLRRTLTLQAERLHGLAEKRYEELAEVIGEAANGPEGGRSQR